MKNTTAKILTLPLRLAMVVLIIGALFKIMHWPFSQLLMSIGSSAIMIFYIFRFVYKNEKVSLDYIKLGLVLLWVFSYYNQVFHLLNLPYYFEIIVLVLLVWWFIQEGISYFGNRKLKGNSVVKLLYYLFIIITIIGLVFGTMFKIQHWPYGALLFTLGMLFLCLALIVDYFVVEKPKDLL